VHFHHQTGWLLLLCRKSTLAAPFWPASPALALSSAEPDPIFAAIEAHNRALKHYYSLESDFPGRSNWNALEGCFLDPDDPHEVRNMVVNPWKAYKAEDAALLALLTRNPQRSRALPRFSTMRRRTPADTPGIRGSASSIEQ
jgi:hypothetical protein